MSLTTCWNWHARRPTPFVLPGVKVIEPATGHVLSLELCRKQCEVVAIDVDSDGVETHPDDDLILGMLDAAVEFAENFTGRAISLKTYEMAASRFPRSGQLEIPLPPLVEVLLFQNGEDSDGPIDPETYVLDDYREPAGLAPIGPWPTGDQGTNAIKVRFRAGYSAEDSDARPMPSAIRQALLLTLGSWYKNREDDTEAALSPIPNGALALLRPLRVRLGMA